MSRLIRRKPTRDYFKASSPFVRLRFSMKSLYLKCDVIQGGFFNWASPENVSRLAPPKNASTGPPYFEKVLSMAAGRGEISNTFNIFNT